MNNKLKYSQTNLKPNASFGSEWIIEIHSFLEREEEEEEEEEEDQDVPVCIFNVPKTLRAYKPDAYTPQVLALGPCHHFHDHLHEIERYKLVVTKKVRTKFPSLKFQDLTQHIKKYESKIHACYHKYLEIDSETLAYMMVLDGIFLLDFLHIYVDRNYSVLASETKMSHLMDKDGKRFSYDLILRDIFMLEKQIPLLVLKMILKSEYSSSSDLTNHHKYDDLLPLMLLGIRKELSPFKLSDDLMTLLHVTKHAHILDLLYRLIVPTCEGSLDNDIDVEEGKETANKGDKTKLVLEEESTREVFEGLWNIISACNSRLIIMF